ncbi:MAG: glycosyltransferase family 2 protein [Candidatus Gracilibacteria bacterium]|nr:glycosyltransferase family 2 protein [Candidatus Gracilibacteria bacterium]
MEKNGYKGATNKHEFNMENKKLISIVLPAYREEKNVPFIYKELQNVIKTISDRYDYEIIYVNDGSPDNTWLEISKLCAADSHVKGVNLSRNFGKEIALTAGVEKSNGDAVITIDVDGQHPVKYIPDFIEKWEQGFDIVYNVRPKIKGASMIKKVSSWLFYKLFNAISEVRIESGTTDYRLIDKKVVKIFLSFTEKNRLYRGIVDMIGLNKCPLVFDALPNPEGRRPSYNYIKLYHLAINSLTSFSVFPLKLVGYMGLLITIFSSLLFIIMLFDKIGIVHLGFTNLAIVVVINTILIGVVLMSLGLMALYIARIHEEVIGRPLYIVRDEINF